ncbi:MBL fold metallo-hydrolase [Candidatus Margulisiibacteriota bacterium]
MKIKTIKVGGLQTNCYVVIDETTKEAVVIDPGDEGRKILPALKDLKVRYIVITHDHFDHIGAVAAVKKATGAQIFSGNEVKFGAIALKVIKTPGHTPDSVCLYTPGYLFAGDTLFSTAHGRTDLPGGSQNEMNKSLKLLATLPDNTLVYPGHDESTSIGLEKERGTLV